jgi:hypothetical protein
MKAVSDRLRSVWSHYLWLREESELRQAVLPSTQACNPAPGRRFLIIRNDNPVVANTGPFVSFDGVMQTPSRRLSATSTIAEPEPRPTSVHSEDSDFGVEEDTSRGRWSLLRSFIGGSKQLSKTKNQGPTGTENTKAASPAPKPSTETASTTKPTGGDTQRPPAHRSFSFRFSLEWVDKRFGTYQQMRLSPPRLPLPAQVFLQTKGINISSVPSTRPEGAAANSSRYAGRALAEWTFISHECQNFFDRRKNEGVPSNRYVETPTLAVEAFRRPG